MSPSILRGEYTFNVDFVAYPLSSVADGIGVIHYAIYGRHDFNINAGMSTDGYLTPLVI